MGKRETFLKRVMTWALCICMAAVLIPVGEPTAKTTAPAVTITYKFQGNDAATAGFAQGTITVKSKTGGNYYLYWANDTKALSGYYEIARLNVKKGKSSSFTFAEQIAIPADATKIIAVKSTKEPADKTVKKQQLFTRFRPRSRLNQLLKMHCIPLILIPIFTLMRKNGAVRQHIGSFQRKTGSRHWNTL